MMNVNGETDCFKIIVLMCILSKAFNTPASGRALILRWFEGAPGSP
jgi:hypothetical protein